MTTAEAASVMGTTPKYVVTLVRRKVLSAKKVNGRLDIMPADVYAWERQAPSKRIKSVLDSEQVEDLYDEHSSILLVARHLHADEQRVRDILLELGFEIRQGGRHCRAYSRTSSNYKVIQKVALDLYGNRGRCNLVCPNWERCPDVDCPCLSD